MTMIAFHFMLEALFIFIDLEVLIHTVTVPSILKKVLLVTKFQY